MSPRRRRHLHPIRRRSLALSDDEVLGILLGVLYRTGELRLDDMCAAVRMAEHARLRRGRVVPILAALRSCCPSGAA